MPPRTAQHTPDHEAPHTERRASERCDRPGSADWHSLKITDTSLMTDNLMYSMGHEARKKGTPTSANTINEEERDKQQRNLGQRRACAILPASVLLCDTNGGIVKGVRLHRSPFYGIFVDASVEDDAPSAHWWRESSQLLQLYRPTSDCF
jgi:hypothetical protein